MIRAVLMASVVVFAADAAAGQDACPARETVSEYLASEFHEEPIAMGLANNGGVIELYTSLDRTTWTIMITMPDGRSCMLAAGQAWESLPTIVAEVPEPGA